MTNAEAEVQIRGWHERVAAACITRGAPVGFTVAVSEAIGLQADGRGTHFRIDGAVYPTISRGPRAGRPNWRKPVPGTARSIIFTAEEMKAI